MSPLQKTAESLRVLGQGPRRFLLFVAFNTISWQVIAGSILALHARALGLNAALVGLLMSIMPFAMILSIWVSPWVNRFGARRLMLVGWTLRNLGALPILFTPLAYARWGAPAAGALLFSGVLFFCTMRALTCVGWFPWLHEILPHGERGRYFSLEVMLVQVANVLVSLLAALILGRHPALHKFTIITLFGVTAGWFSVWLIGRIPGGCPRTQDRRRPLLLDLRLVLRDRDFQRYAGWSALGMFVTMGQGTLVILTLRDYLGVPPAMIMVATAAGALAAVGAGAWWGDLADRHGSALVQLLSAIVLGGSLLGLAMLRRDICTAWMYLPLYMLITFGYCGFSVASNRGMLHRIRPRIRPSYAAYWLALTSFAAGLSSITVGQCIRLGGDAGYWGTALFYGVLLLLVGAKCARIPEKGTNLGRELRRIYEPERPLWSLARICWFVVNPADNNAESAAPRETR